MKIPGCGTVDKLKAKPYRIETILRMRQVSGERSGLFRDVQWMSDALAEFEAVEKKATAACFGNRR